MLTFVEHAFELLMIGLMALVLLVMAVGAVLEAFRKDPEWWR